MGKEYKQETDIPEKTPEELAQIAQLNAVVDSQMELAGWVKSSTESFVYNRQAEIDEIDRILASESLDDGKRRELLEQKNKLREEGGQNKITTSYKMSPEAQARFDRRQAASDAVENDLFAAAGKLAKGDFSITQTQRQQIDDLIGDNFQRVIDELQVNFGSAEDAVNEAADRLMAAGQQQVVNAARENRDRIKQNSELLGRSFSDTDLRQADLQFEQGALADITKTGAAAIAQQIAALRQAQASTIGQVRQNESQARLGLLSNAAQPLAGFGAGMQFAQLQGALNSQNLQNVLGISAIPQNLLQQGLQERLGQPTTTTQVPFNIGSFLGQLGGLGASGAATYFGLQGLKNQG